MKKDLASSQFFITFADEQIKLYEHGNENHYHQELQG